MKERKTMEKVGVAPLDRVGDAAVVVVVAGGEEVVAEEERQRPLLTRIWRGGGRRRTKAAGQTITGGTSTRGRWRGLVALLDRHLAEARDFMLVVS